MKQEETVQRSGEIIFQVEGRESAEALRQEVLDIVNSEPHSERGASMLTE